MSVVFDVSDANDVSDDLDGPLEQTDSLEDENRTKFDSFLGSWIRMQIRNCFLGLSRPGPAHGLATGMNDFLTAFG